MSRYKRNKVYIKNEEIVAEAAAAEAAENCHANVIKVQLDKDGCVTNYRYQVIFVDEYNNWYLIGFFNDLADAEPEVNTYLEGYTAEEGEESDSNGVLWFGEGSPCGRLQEYAGTFSPCFDKIIGTQEGTIEVRGFVYQ